jgi:hypothetical protein
LKLLDHQPIEKGRVLEPATVVALDEISQDDINRGRIAIRGSDRSLRKHLADGIGLVALGILHCILDLHLTRLVGAHREGYQLFERHSVIDAEFEQSRGQGGVFQAQLDDLPH